MEEIQDAMVTGFSFEDENNVRIINDLTRAINTTSSQYTTSYDIIMDGLITDTEVIEDWTATSTSNQTNYRYSIFLHSSVYP